MPGIVDVSIIILNYKTPEMCSDCIRSLKAHSSGFSYEIIVIDNASGDDSQKILTKAFQNQIRFVQNNENLGTAKAFNQGARLAKGDFLFYLNTDTLFINNAIKILLDYMRQHPEVAVTGGNLFNSKEEPTHSFQKIHNLKQMKKESHLVYDLWRRLNKKRWNLEFNYSGKPMPVDYVCAAATLINKDIYLSIGGFDERIFIYGDEALFAHRCKEKGYLSVNVPAAKIIHFEGDSFKKDANLFSKARMDRYIVGNTIMISALYGEEAVRPYLRCLYKTYKHRGVLLKLLGKKESSNKKIQEANVIKHYLEK